MGSNPTPAARSAKNGVVEPPLGTHRSAFAMCVDPLKSAEIRCPYTWGRSGGANRGRNQERHRAARPRRNPKAHTRLLPGDDCLIQATRLLVPGAQMPIQWTRTVDPFLTMEPRRKHQIRPEQPKRLNHHAFDTSTEGSQPVADKLRRKLWTQLGRGYRYLHRQQSKLRRSDLAASVAQTYVRAEVSRAPPRASNLRGEGCWDPPKRCEPTSCRRCSGPRRESSPRRLPLHNR